MGGQGAVARGGDGAPEGQLRCFVRRLSERPERVSHANDYHHCGRGPQSPPR
jgi:hypothetical protein